MKLFISVDFWNNPLTFYSIDGTFLSWSADFRAHLLASFPLPQGVEPIPADVLLPPKYKLEIINDGQDPESLQKLNQRDISQTKLALNKGRVSESGSHALSSQDDSNDNKHPSPDQAESGTALKMPACGAPSTNFWASSALKAPAMMAQTATHLTETTGCSQLKEETPGESAPLDKDLPKSQMLAIPRAIEMKLISNKRLTPESHWQDVRELSFYMSEEFTYHPGDTVTIYPKNFPTDVQALIDLMEWNEVADVRLRFVPEAPDFYHDKFLMTTLPTALHRLEGSTLRDLLIHNLDITAIPKRYFFELVAHYCSDPTHKERLQEFSNPIYTDEFFDYTSRPRRSILEVLQDFPSVKIPFIHAATIFPLIRGRQYSIASGGSTRNSVDVKGQKKVQILVAIVKYRTVLKKIRQGLCSRYLASLPEGSILNIGLERNDSFYDKARLEPYRNLLLITPGTGLAPARSLIWERALVAFKDNTTVGNNYLFFGGRNKSADYFYKEEWTYPSLRTKVFTAFSRDQREKIYVQDIIRQNGKLIADLIDVGIIIYICGSSGNMPKAVRAALIDAMHQFHPLGMKQTKEGIEAVFKTLEKQGRLIQETW
jgi:sulfite reductase alpha subunit-like flavoprotein